MSAAEYREAFRIAAAHPALPGHFPGNPVVPGVVLVDRVAAALGRWRGTGIAGLPQVKFLRPLLPNEDAEIVLTAVAGSIRFCIIHKGETLASGSVEETA